MKKNFLKNINSLYDNNKDLIDKLAEEKKLLENMFLDNRIPMGLKKDILEPYNALVEVIDKRKSIYKSLKEFRSVPNMVGLLYNEAQQSYLSSILKNLQGLSERRNIKIVCFTLDKVNLEEDLVEGMVVSGSSITQSAVSIPKFVLNIGRYLISRKTNKIKQMYMLYGTIVVNPVNIFNQAVVFDTLSALSDIKKCILPVSALSPSIISDYLAKTNTLFLLPERGLHNNAAFRIEKSLRDGRTNYCIETRGNSLYCDEKNLFTSIKKMISNKKYIAVEGMKTLMWNGAPLEARVYVQKDITGKWSVTEMIAKNEIFLHDSIYKDTADELERVLLNIIPNKIKDIECNLENLSLNICSYLDYYFLFLGSCTVDFIIDENGTPFLIAFGGWDQKDYLFKINGNQTWDKYLANSVDYLLYLKQAEREDGRLK